MEQDFLVGVGAEEGTLIAALRAGMVSSPLQVNAAFETDAELLDLGGPDLLAVTVDTLTGGAELMTARTPYEKGWLTATVSLSDLAAVGARPVGVLVSCSLPRGKWTAADCQAYGRGASDAAGLQGCHIIGGDTNWADDESFTSCGLGLAPRHNYLRRVGARSGDVLYTTGPVGAGNAAGFRATVLGGASGEPWLPAARMCVAELLRDHARACVDTSDGLVSAAVTLAQASGLGMELYCQDDIYEPAAAMLADAACLPRWLLAAGEWGEYELLYALAPGVDEVACNRALTAHGLQPVRVGVLTVGQGLLVHGDDGGRWDARLLLPEMRALDPAGDLLAALRELAAKGG